MSVKSGRPRNPDLDAAILAAVCDLLAEGGYPAATPGAVAERAGTTKPTIYRRHRNAAELVVAALVDRFGDDPTHDTGSLRGDLADLQRHQRELFTDPVVTGALPGLLLALRSDEDLAGLFGARFLGPRRAATAAILHRAADRGEIQPCEDWEWICDLVTGPMFLRAALPGVPPIDETLVEQTVAAALAALRA